MRHFLWEKEEEDEKKQRGRGREVYQIAMAFQARVGTGHSMLVRYSSMLKWNQTFGVSVAVKSYDSYQFG